MSVKDIIFSASAMMTLPTEPPTLAPTTPTLYNKMPVNSATVNEDMSWWDMCYDNVSMFAAIRRYKNQVSFSDSPVAGETWWNANSTYAGGSETLEAYVSGVTNNAICGNAGTFIVCVTPKIATGKTIVYRFKYNPNTTLFDKTSVLTIGTVNATAAIPQAPVALTVVTKLNGNSQALCCAYGDGVFFVGGNKWYAYSNDDGLTWKAQATTYTFADVVFGEAKTTTGTVPRFMFTTTNGAPNETVGYAAFDGNKDLTLFTTQVSGTANGKCAYSDGIFMIVCNTINGGATVYTENLKTFETGPTLPNIVTYRVVNSATSTGNIVGGDKCFIAVPSSGQVLVSNQTTKTISGVDYIHYMTGTITSVGSVSVTMPSESATSTIYKPTIGITPNPYLNSYVYKLSTNRSSTGWTESWQYVPLTHSKQEAVNNWPVETAANENNITVYSWSSAGPYRAVAFGKGVFLAARYLGDKLLTINPNYTGTTTI